MVRKFLNKVFRHFVPVCAALLLLVCSFAVPSSAAAPSSSVVAPIRFDSLGFLYGEAFERSYQMPFPGNVVGPNNVSGEFVQYKSEDSTLNNSVYVSSVNVLENNIIRTNYRLAYDYTGWGVLLYNSTGDVIESALINDSSGYNVSFSYGTVGLSGTVSIAMQAAKPSFAADGYSLSTKTFLLSNVPFDENGVDLFDLIDSAITDFSYRDNDYVYLTNLSVRFFFDDTSVDEINMHIEHVSRLSSNSYRSWFDQYDLPRNIVVDSADPSDVDFVDWLTVSVGGFLNFQLWPGMTLNEILWMILVAGILFWFLKLTI